MMWEGPTLEIAGREYTVRRLGILDVMALGKIYASCQARQAFQLKTLFDGAEISVNMLGATLISAIPYEGEAICKFMASLVGVDVESFKDPNVFPLGSEIQIIDKLIEHEDVLAFLERVQGMAKNPALKKLTKRLNGPSTASKKGTAGKTATSKAKA